MFAYYWFIDYYCELLGDLKNIYFKINQICWPFVFYQQLGCPMGGPNKSLSVAGLILALS